MKKISILLLIIALVPGAITQVNADQKTVEYGACWQYGRKGTHVYSDLTSSTNRLLHTRSVGNQNVASGWKYRGAYSSAWAVGVNGATYYNIK